MRTQKDPSFFLIALICFSIICSNAFKIEERSTQISQPSLTDRYKLIKQKMLERWQLAQGLFKQYKHLKSANLQLIQTVFSNGYTTLPTQNLKGNMLIIGRYALLPQNTFDVPTLIKLNLDSMTNETIIFPQLKLWSENSSLSISDLQNGDIAYGASTSILILDRNTLQLKQTLELSRSNEIIKFDIFLDPKTSQSKILVETGSQKVEVKRLYELKKKSESPDYVLNFISFSPARLQSRIFNLGLTGLNKGISIYDYDLIYWQNFYEILDQSTDPKHLLKSRDKIALSYDETMLVVRNNLNYYEFYDIAEDYDLKLKKSLIISYNQHRKADFTTDDKYLFVAMYNPQKIHNIAKVIVNEGQFILITDTDGISDNHIDYNLFSSETDRMIVLALKGTSHILQLRTISTLKIIHELPLKFNYTVLNYKLVGSKDWGLTFGLSTQFQTDYREEFNSNLYQYSIVGDKIVASITGKFNYGSIKPCYKYIITHLDDKGVKIFDYLNFTQLALIQTATYEYVDIEKHFMSIGQQNFRLFDLTKSLDYQGIFYKGEQPLLQKIVFMFPKRKILMDITTGQYGRDTIMRIVYNISEPQVKNIVKMEHEVSYIDAQKLYIPYVGSTCNKVFYIVYNSNNSASQLLQRYINPRLIEYDECSKNTRSFPIKFDEVQGVLIFLSSDNKYIIIVMLYIWTTIPDLCLIEIRAIDKLEDIVMHQEIALGEYFNYNSIMRFRADLLSGSQLILKTTTFVLSMNIKDNVQQKKPIK